MLIENIYPSIFFLKFFIIDFNYKKYKKIKNLKIKDYIYSFLN